MPPKPKPIDPALKPLNDALVGQAYTAGTREAGPHDLKLFYHKAGDNATDNVKHARLIDFASVTTEELEDLAQTCQPATFGRGGEDVLDEACRKAGKLDTGFFSTCLDLPRHNILDSITTELMDDNKIKQQKLTAELYKLNVYGKGAFFKAHKDTPRGTNMIGSLVVVLPTEHQGGALILRHNNQEWTFDSGKKLSESPNTSLISYVAFYSDVEHEVTPVTSGHRVTLTYNLYSIPRDDSAFSSASSSEASLDRAFQAAFEELLDNSSFMPSGGRIAWAFSHQYPFKDPRSLSRWERTEDMFEQAVQDIIPLLKGSDARLYRVCQRLGLESDICVAYEELSEWAYRGDEEELDPELYELKLGAFPVTILFYELLDVSPWHYVEQDMAYLLEKRGGEVIKTRVNKGKQPTFLWATQPNTLNRVEDSYTAYGNEASTEFIYGDICLVVTIPDVESRK